METHFSKRPFLQLLQHKYYSPRVDATRRQALPKIGQPNPYQKALLLYERGDKRRRLKLAREIRNSLVMEEELTVQLVKEAELALEFLRSDAKKAHLRVETATLEIGAIRAALQQEGISETSVSDDDEEFVFAHEPATSSDPISENDSASQPSEVMEEQQTLPGSMNPPHDPYPSTESPLINAPSNSLTRDALERHTAAVT